MGQTTEATHLDALAKNFRRVAADSAARRNVVADHRACPHNRPVANRHAGQDHRPSADKTVATDTDRPDTAFFVACDQ